MRVKTAISLAVLLVAGLFVVQNAYGQQSGTARTIVQKTPPRYPELARPMKLEGNVKVTVIVAPNGAVKSMRAMGGSPLLLNAAQTAIAQWKWAPAAKETSELVELHFSPN